MSEELKVYEEKMEKSIDALLNEYASIRAGRANPHVLDKIKVDYYGAPTPLQQVANISVPEPRMILIQPWEKKLIKDSDPDFRSGYQPEQRWKCSPPDFPGAY